MEILANFGVEPVLLVAQIFNFLIIAWVLKRFAYKPILKLLQERKVTIEQGLKNAEDARKLLEQANEKETAILKSAQAQAKKLQDEAKKQSDQVLKTAEENAKKRTEQLLKQASEQISKETKEAEKRLETHVSELAVAFLQKAVSGLFSEKEQKEVMQKAMKSLKGKN
jgi:F-type H+-transporting ATPase subunit b